MAEVAVITGGGSGLGEACARELAERGASVWLLDLNISQANDVVKSIQASGGEAQALQVDVSVAEEVEQAALCIKRDGGTPSSLVTAAGIIESGTMLFFRFDFILAWAISLCFFKASTLEDLFVLLLKRSVKSNNGGPIPPCSISFRLRLIPAWEYFLEAERLMQGLFSLCLLDAFFLDIKLTQGFDSRHNDN